MVFNYSKEARRSLLSLSGYRDETVFSQRADNAAPDTAFKKRAATTAQSKVQTYISAIYHGLMNQPKYLVPLVPINIEFMKQSNGFALTSNANADTFKVKIVSMKLFVKKVRVRASVKVELEAQLLKEPALYNLRQASVRPMFISAGAKQVSFENIFPAGVVPNFGIVGLLTQSKFRGDYSSPYEFLPHSLTSLKITINGQVSPSPDGFSPQYSSTTQPNWTEEYFSLFGHQMKQNQEKIVSYDEYTKGFCLYYFTFGNENPMNHDHVTLKRIASGARLDLTFDSNSANEALVALLYSECQGQLAIDGQRKVTRDYYI